MSQPDDQNAFESKVNLKHVVLTIILLSLLLFRPLLPSAVIDSIFLPTIIVAAWLAGGKTRRGLIVTVILGLVAFGLLVFDIVAHEKLRTMMHQPRGLIVGAIVLFLFIYCGGVILHSLFKAERVFVNEIIGTFNIYLIMGYAWSYAYLILELFSPGSFLPLDSVPPHSVRFIYFSFITLTTVGFGDTIPATPLAETLVIFEAIIGQFYVAVVVAYLVAMYITHEIEANRKKD